jgi:hypothetical protein
MLTLSAQPTAPRIGDVQLIPGLQEARLRCCVDVFSRLVNGGETHDVLPQYTLEPWELLFVHEVDVVYRFTDYGRIAVDFQNRRNTWRLTPSCSPPLLLLLVALSARDRA